MEKIDKKKVIHHAIEVFDDYNWNDRELSLNVEGCPVLPQSDSAASFCVLGAAWKSLFDLYGVTVEDFSGYEDMPDGLYDDIQHVARKFLPPCSLNDKQLTEYLNDHEFIDKEDAIEFLKKVEETIN